MNFVELSTFYQPLKPSEGERAGDKTLADVAEPETIINTFVHISITECTENTFLDKCLKVFKCKVKIFIVEEKTNYPYSLEAPGAFTACSDFAQVILT